LVSKKKDKDPECVRCHVLGFDAKGGYVSRKDSPQFASVQCENCHGPSKDHALKGAKAKKGLAKAVCVSCHLPPHATQFSFEKYWDKIKH
jgi:hypothetical protein